MLLADCHCVALLGYCWLSVKGDNKRFWISRILERSWSSGKQATQSKDTRKNAPSVDWDNFSTELQFFRVDPPLFQIPVKIYNMFLSTPKSHISSLPPTFGCQICLILFFFCNIIEPHKASCSYLFTHCLLLLAAATDFTWCQSKGWQSRILIREEPLNLFSTLLLPRQTEIGSAPGTNTRVQSAEGQINVRSVRMMIGKKSMKFYL